VVTKRLIVEGSAGSGVTIDCAGASVDGSALPRLSSRNAKTDMIQVRSAGAATL
jgi:hypothetical protein